jgi:hypothetical protein
MTGPGVFHGGLVFGSQNPGDNVMTDTNLLPYPRPPPGCSRYPVSLHISDFHFLLCYEDRLVAVSLLLSFCCS